MKGSPTLLRISRALDGVLPGAAHVPEAVVTLGIERVERQRQAARTGLRQMPRHVLGDAHAVGADDDPQAALTPRAARSRGCRGAAAARRR